MADPEKAGRERKDRDDAEKPPGEGATYRTSKHSKTGVGHEQPPKDLGEKGGGD